MTDEKLVAIVRSASVPFDLGTRQEQYNQVRFLHDRTSRSLNLGYRSPNGPFVADFVFKGQSKETNGAKCTAFLGLFGGTRGMRSTAFARLEPTFADTEWLVRVIQGYWAMGHPNGTIPSSGSPKGCD